MSQKTMSSKASSTNSAIKVLGKDDSAQPISRLFLDQLEEDCIGTVIVMVGRIWDVNAATGRYLSTDFVVSDSKGNMMHCTAKATVAHNFLKLKEGGIYSIKNFVVLPNREDFKIFRHALFMLEFDGSTIIRKVTSRCVGFLRYPFQLIDFDSIEVTNNKYMIDVAGYVTNAGRTNHTKSGSKTLDFYLANGRGQALRVTLWGGLGDILIEKKTARVGMCAIVVSSVFVKTYNNKLYLSSSSFTSIYDNDDILALQELKAMKSCEEPNKEMWVVDSVVAREGTIENLLLWARNRKNDAVTFHCKVVIEGINMKNGWNYLSCGSEKCRKSVDRQLGKFKCKTCNKTVDYPVLRYRLELVVADDTAHTVVVLFNELATELLKCSADSLMGMEDETAGDELGLPTAISNLIGTTHIMELKSHSYYEYGTYESFTCWKISPAEKAADDGSASNHTPTSDKPSTSFKRLAKHPSVCTPSKPNEDKRKDRDELEDSDPDEVSSTYDGNSAKKKNKRIIYEESE